MAFYRRKAELVFKERKLRVELKMLADFAVFEEVPVQVRL
jgi:hypothetical protein